MSTLVIFFLKDQTGRLGNLIQPTDIFTGLLSLIDPLGGSLVGELGKSQQKSWRAGLGSLVAAQ